MKMEGHPEFIGWEVSVKNPGMIVIVYARLHARKGHRVVHE